ncbi:MAG: tetratricopeptide repeat protein [Desulfovibrionaceae bacterium]
MPWNNAWARAWVVTVCLLALLVGACGSQSAETTILDQAREAVSSGSYLRAEELYELYIQTFPRGKQRWEAWNKLLDVTLGVRGNQEKAASILEAMYLEFGVDGRRAWGILSRLADVYRAQRKPDKAIETLQKALGIPSLEAGVEPRIYRRLARINLSRREYDQTREMLEACVAKATDVAIKGECLYDLGQTLGFMNQHDYARKVLQRVMNLDGVEMERRSQAALLLADMYEQENDLSKARDLLISILDTYPNPKVVETRLKHLEAKMP